MRKNNIDELSILSDDRVFGMLHDSQNKIGHAERQLKRANDSSREQYIKSLQVEHCYISREAEVRVNRKKAHKLYLEEKKYKKF